MIALIVSIIISIIIAAILWYFLKFKKVILK